MIEVSNYVGRCRMGMQRVYGGPFFAYDEGVGTEPGLKTGATLGVNDCRVFMTAGLRPDGWNIGTKMRKSILAHAGLRSDDGDDMNHGRGLLEF